MGVVKPFLIFAVAAFNLAVMAGCIGRNGFVTDTRVRGGLFKMGGDVLFRVGKAIGKLKAVVGLYAFNGDAAPSKPGRHLFKEVGGGIDALLFICAEGTQTVVLVNGGVLEKTWFWVGNTGTWNDFHIHLYPLAGVGHLLIRLGGVPFFRFRSRQRFQASHDTEERFGPTGIASFA